VYTDSVKEALPWGEDVYWQTAGEKAENA